MTTRKAKKSAAKRSLPVKTKSEGRPPRSMPKAGKDPEGGLTAKGREFFNQKEGSHLRPGVKGAADTPEKMMRKGSFLRRHFANPRGPMVDEKGQPTRLALSAQAWGEPLPKTMAAAKKLADKGHQLLAKYHEVQDGATATKPVAKKVAKRATKTGTGTRTKTGPKKSTKTVVKTTPAKAGKAAEKRLG